MFVLCPYFLHIIHECCPKVGIGRYTFQGFAIVCLCSLCQTPFPGQQIRCLILYLIQQLFRSVVLRWKLRLCSPLPFLKPICASLRNDCTLYLVGCSRVLAYILPTWLSRELPPYISTVSFAALLLPYYHYDCSLPVVWDFSGIPCFVGDTGLAR